ncbi:MAG: hypothetical protein L0Z50_21950 [Verrucomicrobiales bacterium]|nr:hypothetical protein [Verrucomicrobiales bacterium]
MHTIKNKTAFVTGKFPTMQTLLVESRWGRTALHVRCAVRDHHLLWHWRGILRELRPA